MIIPKFPNPAEIALAIEKVEAILADKKINTYKNKPLKEGYQECLRMLKDRLVNPDNQFFVADKEEELELAGSIYREQMLPIKELKTEKHTVTANSANEYNITYSNSAIESGDYIKAFLWNSLENMKPLTEAKILR